MEQKRIERRLCFNMEMKDIFEFLKDDPLFINLFK